MLEIVQGPGTDTPSVLAAIAHSAAVVMTVYCGGQSLASSKMYPNFNYVKMKDRSTKLLVGMLDFIYYVRFYILQMIETLTRVFCGNYCFLHINKTPGANKTFVVWLRLNIVFN